MEPWAGAGGPTPAPRSKRATFRDRSRTGAAAPSLQGGRETQTWDPARTRRARAQKSLGI